MFLWHFRFQILNDTEVGSLNISFISFSSMLAPPNLNICPNAFKKAGTPARILFFHIQLIHFPYYAELKWPLKVKWARFQKIFFELFSQLRLMTIFWSQIRVQIVSRLFQKTYASPSDYKFWGPSIIWYSVHVNNALRRGFWACKRLLNFLYKKHITKGKNQSFRSFVEV